MNISNKDRAIVDLLVNRRRETQALPLRERDNELGNYGIPFVELFRDINPSLSFLRRGSDVHVCADDSTLFHAEDKEQILGKKEMYLHYNQTIDMEANVLQRLLLLQKLEKERWIIWINTGKRKPNLFEQNDLFYLIHEEDKKYVNDRINYEAFATEELIEFVNNKYLDNESKRHKESITRAKIANWIAIFVGIISMAISMCYRS